jgi:hypothetical protein
MAITALPHASASQQFLHAAPPRSNRLSTHRQREVQDLEGDLGLVLGVDGEFADGIAEMSAE